MCLPQAALRVTAAVPRHRLRQEEGGEEEEALGRRRRRSSSISRVRLLVALLGQGSGWLWGQLGALHQRRPQAEGGQVLSWTLRCASCWACCPPHLPQQAVLLGQGQALLLLVALPAERRVQLHRFANSMHSNLPSGALPVADVAGPPHVHQFGGILQQSGLQVQLIDYVFTRHPLKRISCKAACIAPSGHHDDNARSTEARTLSISPTL
jgi:hypothetical protein